jgi:very-short-patch-repair endonuclease
MEYVILTRPIRGVFSALPNAYKVDLADPERHLAIEIDGGSHKSLRVQEIDRKKTNALSCLGWSVLRFTNEEVLNSPLDVVEKIRAFTI